MKPNKKQYKLPRIVVIFLALFHLASQPISAKSKDNSLFLMCDQVNLGVNMLSFTCNSNATNSIPSDDFYNILFNFSKEQTGGDTYELFLDNVSQGIFTYGALQSINSAANSASAELRIVDIETSCEISQSIGPFFPCSTDCEIFPSLLIQACHNNQTDFDATDDVHEFTVQSQAINGSSNFDVLVNGLTITTGSYGEMVNFDLPADGSNPSVLLIDSDNNQCNYVLELAPLDPCSQDCGASIQDVHYTCVDNEYLVEFNIEVFNGNPLGKKYVQIDDQIAVEIDVNNYSFTLPADNLQHSITLTDIDSPDCTDMVTIGPLTACDAACSINAQASESTCSNNDTDNTSDDDSYTAVINVTNVDGSTQWTDEDGNNYNYGEDIIVGPYLISEGSKAYLVTDSENPSCTFLVDVIAPATCSSCSETMKAGLDQEISCKTPTVPLEATVSAEGDYTWSHKGQVISNSITAEASEEGWYLFEVAFVTGCYTEDSLYVSSIQNQIPEAKITSDNGNNINCTISEINLSTLPLDNVSYSWESNVGVTEGLELQILAGDVILLTALDTISGCSSTEIFKVDTFFATPEFELMPFNPITCERNEVLLEIEAISSDVNVAYKWYDLDENVLSEDQQIMLDEAGTYYVEMIDLWTTCTSWDTFTVELLEQYPLIAESADKELACDETITNVSVEILSSESIEVFWTTENGTIVDIVDEFTATIEGPGMYFSEIVDQETGCSTMDSLEVRMMDNTLDFDEYTLVDESCDQKNGAIMGLNITGGEEPYMISLNNESITNNADIEELVAGEYLLEVIDNNGCIMHSNFVIAEAEDIELQGEFELAITEGESQMIQVETNLLPEEIESVSWNPVAFLSCTDCLTPIATPTSDMYYQVTVVSKEGCIATTDIEITLRESTDIYVPNSFSPNDDGINEYFTIFGKGIAQIQMLEIFNRWGEKVFVKENFPANEANEGWNGRYKSKGNNANIFGYYAEIKMEDGSIEIRKGDITLIR